MHSVAVLIMKTIRVENWEKNAQVLFMATFGCQSHTGEDVIYGEFQRHRSRGEPLVRVLGYYEHGHRPRGYRTAARQEDMIFYIVRARRMGFIFHHFLRCGPLQSPSPNRTSSSSSSNERHHYRKGKK